MRKTVTLIAILVLLMGLTSSNKQTTIFIIGDSTAANKDISKNQKERGWGMVLQCYFDDAVIIDNHAKNGRSSLSFITEGRWEKVLSQIKPGDYVIIQFGHNDEKPGIDRHTDPGSTFDYNLAKYIRETREHGGIPVVMNAVVRRNFSTSESQKGDDESLRNTTFADGQQTVEGDTLVDTHGLYIVAPRDVAKRMNAHFIDANRITHDIEQSMGAEGSKKLHMWFRPGEEPTVPEGRQDNTHYNIYGAHVVAKRLADALAEEIPLLAGCRVNYDIAVDREGRGDFIDLQEAVNSVGKDQKATIQILGGEWERPVLPRKSKIQFVMRFGASWK